MDRGDVGVTQVIGSEDGVGGKGVPGSGPPFYRELTSGHSTWPNSV